MCPALLSLIQVGPKTFLVLQTLTDLCLKDRKTQALAVEKRHYVSVECIQQCGANRGHSKEISISRTSVRSLSAVLHSTYPHCKKTQTLFLFALARNNQTVCNFPTPVTTQPFFDNLLIFFWCRRHTQHQMKISMCGENSDVSTVLAEQNLIETPY